MKLKSKKVDHVKCPGCNWEVEMIFAFDCNPIDEEGLCGECLGKLLAEEGYEILSG